ncbi:28S ribosomal protein S28, mitochondrial [Nilaparvata lugens]|uniref:28S ribosomal protein S28, mitochondrial n=1 Tax=Nilaparvata lugens TaxID=108931 RepID=UPI00193E69AE|nr:28S ribosomal protein S28, mitochondrial [Nilaparvata lugens]
MIASTCCFKSLYPLIRPKNMTPISSLFVQKFCFSDENTPAKKGFAEAFERHSKPITEEEPKPDLSFATLFKNSKLIDLGDPQGKTVVGKIFHVVGDDLYIDFGWKFHCVCTRPNKNGSDYVRGAKVRIMIKDLELSTRFLGSEKDLTILEADATLLGLISSPARSTQQFDSQTSRAS